MHNLVNVLRSFFEKLPVFLLKYKLVVWPLFIGATAIIAMGVPRMVVDTSMDAVFPEGHPVHDTYVDFREQFGSDSGLGILYRAKDGDVFSENSLRALQSIHNELVPYRDNYELRKDSPLKHIELVTDLINVGYLESRAGEVMIARNFIGKSLPKLEKEREALKNTALSHPNYPGVYVSENAEYATIILGTDFGAIAEGFNPDQEFIYEDELEIGNLSSATEGTKSKSTKFQLIDSEECSEFMKAVKAITEKPEHLEHLEFFYVGDVAMQAFDHDVIGPEVIVIFSSMLLVFFGILFFMFGNVTALLWALAVDVLAVVWTVGIIGWSGVAMSELINPLMLLVLVCGIADSVHILSGYILRRKRDYEHADALKATMRKSGLACFLTSVTTAVGFMSLISVELVELRVFGIFAGVGILCAFVISVILLPLLIDLRKPVSSKKIATENVENSPVQRYLRSVDRTVFKHPRKIIAVFALLTLACVPGILQITVDTNPLEALKKSTQIRQDAEEMENHLTGTQGMHILINMHTSDAFKDLDVLNAMDKLERTIEQHPSGLVDTAGSITIGIKNSYKALQGGDPINYILPQDEKLVKQLLFLFQNAHPESNRKLISDDYSKAHIQLTLKNRGSAEYVPLMTDIKQHIADIMGPLEQKYPEMDIRFTGSLAIVMEMYDIMSWAQIKSFGLAFIIITMILLILFGSLRMGLIAMVPNLIPVCFVFGLMGWLGIPLDVVALIVAPIIIGIVVDDTIHFFSAYKTEMADHGDNEKAVSKTVLEVGQALIYTSLTISFGLLCMLYSSHMGFTYLGILGAFAIFIALLADLYLFPAMCLLLKPAVKKESEQVNNAILVSGGTND